MTKTVESSIKDLAQTLAWALARHHLDTGDLFASWEDLLPGGESLAKLVQAEVEDIIEEVEAKELKSRKTRARLYPNDPKYAEYREDAKTEVEEDASTLGLDYQDSPHQSARQLYPESYRISDMMDGEGIECEGDYKKMLEAVQAYEHGEADLLEGITLRQYSTVVADLILTLFYAD